MSLRPGRAVAIAIVVLWAYLFASHLRKSYDRDTSATAIDLAALSSPGDARLSQRGIFYRGSRIGYLRERRIPSGGGIRTEQEGRLLLNVLGREREMDLFGTAEIGAGGELRAFTFRLATASGRSPFETEVRGRVEDGELALTVRSGGSERTERRPAGGPIVLPLNLYHAVASQGLTPGETYRVRMLDPMTLTEGEVEILVVEPEVIRWGDREEEGMRLRTSFGGLTTHAWVNVEGEVLKEETPLGWTLLKEPPGDEQRLASGPELLSDSALPAIGKVGEPSSLRRTRLRLLRFPSTWSGLEGGRQTLVAPDEVVIEKELPPWVGAESLSEDERREALRSDAFVQADDPVVAAEARRLTRGLSDSEAARRLTGWVHESIRKTPTLSLPNAREVLEQKAGDCNEHTVLFTALARAVGIPTRVAVGVTFLDGQFYYHAWPEVWLSRWVAVDPTLGQFPADPLHLRLLTGGLEKQYEVLSLLGRGAAIEIREAR